MNHKSLPDSEQTWWSHDALTTNTMSVMFAVCSYYKKCSQLLSVALKWPQTVTARLKNFYSNLTSVFSSEIDLNLLYSLVLRIL